MLLNTQGAADYPTPGTERRYNVYHAGTTPTGAPTAVTQEYVVLKFL